MVRGIFTCLAFFVLTLKAQDIPNGITIDVHNNNDFSGFETLDSAIASAQVIMTGEVHTYREFNTHLEMKMLKYLNQKTGLKHFIIELGAARAYYLNRYTSQSDTMAERILKATTAPRYMDLFKRIRKLNSELPDSQKIIIHGIDVERFFDLPLLRIGEIFNKQNEVPEKLKGMYRTMRGVYRNLELTGLEAYQEAQDISKKYNSYGQGNQTYFYFVPTITEFLHYWDSLNPDIQTWLGKDYENAQTAVTWLREYMQWRNYENTTFQYVWREENIFKNLTRLIEQYPAGKFYGQFGRCHIAYAEQNGDCMWYGYHSVLNKLRTRYYAQPEKVLSIGIYYIGTDDRKWYSDREEREALQKESEKLKDATKNHTVTLFNIGGENYKLPELKKKFSFVVVNHEFITDATKDSVESEVKTPVKKSSSEFYGYRSAAFLLDQSTMNMNPLNEYFKQQGYTSHLKPANWYGINWQWNQQYFLGGIQAAWQTGQRIASTDSGNLNYRASAFGFQLLGVPLNWKKWQLAAGLNVQFGREQISWEPKNVNFITVKNPTYFVNPFLLAGPQVQLQTMLFSRLYLGCKTAMNFDLSQNQWRYKGSAAEYGSNGSISKGMGGWYFGLLVGMVISDDNYSYY